MIYDYILPLKLKNTTLNSGILQGPLAGYSNAAFRRLIWQHSSPALCYTEMLPAKQICNERGRINRYTYKHTSEQFLCYQISGNDPNCLADATKLVADMGADCIDLNIGCPKPKIRNKGHGSALLDNPELLFECLSAMKAATTKPIIAKIRINKNKNDYNVLNSILAAKVDALVVHGRHWQQDYKEPCNWHQVAELIKDVKIPVVLNGDLDKPENAINALHITKAKHIMISRGSMGQPDLISSLHTNKTPINNLNISIKWFILHLKYLLEIENEYIVNLQSRSIARYYFKKYPEIKTKNLMNKILQSKDVTNTIDFLNNHLL